MAWSIWIKRYRFHGVGHLDKEVQVSWHGASGSRGIGFMACHIWIKRYRFHGSGAALMCGGFPWSLGCCSCGLFTADNYSLWVAFVIVCRSL